MDENKNQNEEKSGNNTESQNDVNSNDEQISLTDKRPESSDYDGSDAEGGNGVSDVEVSETVDTKSVLDVEKNPDDSTKSRLYEKIDILDYDYELTGEAVENKTESLPEIKETGERAKKKALVIAGVLVFLALFICLKFVLGDRNKDTKKSSGGEEKEPTVTVVATATPTPKDNEQDFRKSAYPIVEIEAIVEARSRYNFELDYSEFEDEAFTDREYEMETGTSDTENVDIGVEKQNAEIEYLPERESFDMGTTSNIGYIRIGDENFYDFVTGGCDTIEIQYYVEEIFVERAILSHDSGRYKLEIHRYELELTGDEFYASHREVSSDTYYYDDLYERKATLPYSKKEAVCYILSAVGDPMNYSGGLRFNNFSDVFVLFTDDPSSIYPYYSMDDSDIVKIEHWKDPDMIFADGIPESYGMGSVENRGRIVAGNENIIDFLQYRNDELILEYSIGDFIVQNVVIKRQEDSYSLQTITNKLVPSELKPYNAIVNTNDIAVQSSVTYDKLVAYRITDYETYMYVLCQDPVPDYAEMAKMSAEGTNTPCFVLFTGTAFEFLPEEGMDYHVFETNPEPDVPHIVKVKTNDSISNIFSEAGDHTYALGNVTSAGRIEEGTEFFEAFVNGEISDLEIDYYVDNFMVGQCFIVDLGGVYHLDVFSYMIWVYSSENEYSIYVNKDDRLDEQYDFDEFVAYRDKDITEMEKAYRYVFCNQPVPDYKTMLDRINDKSENKECFALLFAGNLGFKFGDTQGTVGEEYYSF